ncbi:MAG: NhaP-type Na+/H+ and K+/H+ antiporter, partial [Planctomycetota bacterium]
ATRLKIVRDGTTRILESVLVRIGQASVHDYDELLRVNKGFAISSLLVEKDNWMIRRSLRELRLTDEGVIILNISRGEGLIIATPGPETLIEPGDKLLLYGLDEKLAALAARTVREGAVQHEVERKQHLVRKQAEESARAELAGVEETLRYSEASDSQEP